MRDMSELFDALSRSKFRCRFRLKAKERAYLELKGIEVVMEHADKFVRERLAAASPANDGKQTPMRGHPVFLAQHATATCCRGCLWKWHHIPKANELTEEQVLHILAAIRIWLEQ